MPGTPRSSKVDQWIDGSTAGQILKSAGPIPVPVAATPGTDYSVPAATETFTGAKTILPAAGVPLRLEKPADSDGMATLDLITNVTPQNAEDYSLRLWFDAPDTGKGMQPLVYWDGTGGQYTQRWMVISGHTQGSGDTFKVRRPAPDDPMLGIWADFPGPCLQMRTQGAPGSYILSALDGQDPPAYRFGILNDGGLRWGQSTEKDENNIPLWDVALDRYAQGSNLGLKTPQSLAVGGVLGVGGDVGGDISGLAADIVHASGTTGARVKGADQASLYIHTTGTNDVQFGVTASDSAGFVTFGTSSAHDVQFQAGGQATQRHYASGRHTEFFGGIIPATLADGSAPGNCLFYSASVANLTWRDLDGFYNRFARVRTATSPLDFGSTPAQSSADLTISVTGAAVGDSVIVTPPGTVNANACFTGWVSAADVVSIRLNNYSASAIDPPSGTYRATVFKS